MTFFKNIIHFSREGYFNKDQMTEFENENQPVCSSVSSCSTLNASSILMSSLSSIFIIVCHVDLSRFSRSFSVSLDTLSCLR